MSDNQFPDLAQRVKLYATLPSYKSASGFPETLPAYTNGRPKIIKIGELELKIDVSFLGDGKILRPEYFQKGSEFYPGKLSHFIFGLDELQNNELAMGLIATEMAVDGKVVTVYDKIFVTPRYQGKGHMPRMVAASMEIFKPKIVLLKTKSEHAHNQYSKLNGDYWEEINGFKVHGYGFFNSDGTEKFEGAKKLFEEAALKLSLKPESFLGANEFIY